MVVADGGGKKGRIVGVYNRLLIPDEMRPQGPHNTWLIEKLLTVCKCVRETVGVCFQAFRTVSMCKYQFGPSVTSMKIAAFCL